MKKTFEGAALDSLLRLLDNYLLFYFFSSTFCPVQKCRHGSPERGDTLVFTCQDIFPFERLLLT